MDSSEKFTVIAMWNLPIATHIMVDGLVSLFTLRFSALQGAADNMHTAEYVQITSHSYWCDRSRDLNLSLST